MEELERLVGQIARALNIPAETVADYAKSDEALKGLSEAFKTNREKLDTAGYQRAEGKIKTTVERALKAAGVDSPDLDKLTEGLDQVKAAAASGTGATLTDEQALALPAVRRALTDAENSKMQAVTAARKEADTELQQKRAAFIQEQQDAKVEAQARTLIAELNPNLNPDSAKALRQVARLVADVKTGNYKAETDGSFTPVDAEGKYLDNGAGGSKSFFEHVREVVTSEYDLPAATARTMTGVKQGDVPSSPTGAMQHYKGDAPKTMAELDEAIIRSASNPDALAELIAFESTLKP